MVAALHSLQVTPKIRTIPPSTAEVLAKRVQSALHERRFFSNASSWQKELEALSPEILRQVVEVVCQKEDSLDALDRLAEFLPLEKLQEAIRIQYPKYTDALRTATLMLQEAKNYLHAEKGSHLTPTLKIHFSKVLEAVVLLLDSVVRAFGVGQFFQQAENDLHADFKAQKIVMLLSLFTMLTGILAPVMGPAILAASVGGTMFAISVLSLIFPHIRPAPTHLPEGENWSRLLHSGKLDAVHGRKKCLDEIARTLIASKRVKTHPLLIGKSGIGKTEAVKAFVQAVERGDYPALKGKRVIYFNTASLVQYKEMFSSGNKILTRLSEEIGRHQEKYILVFDEIHYALKEKEDSAIGEQLKTMLDPGESKFPYVIGITTEEEYYRDIYVNHTAFARRFKAILIDNPQPYEILEILSNTLLQQANKAIIDSDALPYLLDKTKQAFQDAPQPLTAQKILMKCIQAVTNHERSSLDQQAEEIQSQIESLYAQAAFVQPDQHDTIIAELQSLEAKLRLIEENLSREEENICRLSLLKEEFAKTKKTTMQKVVKVAHFQANSLSKKEKKELASFLLLSRFKVPLTEARIRSDADRFGIPTVINHALIDKMIAEEQENDRKIQEARSRGHHDLAARGAAGAAVKR